MITSLKLWNEPNNLSHWDFLIDRGWDRFADMTRRTVATLRRTCPGLPIVLGGVSPIDRRFLRLLAGKGALDGIDVLAVHGFPLDWNLWPLEEWPERIGEVGDEFERPVWVTETGVSSFGGENAGAWGLERSLDVLRGERVYWYTLLDLAPERDATTRHREREGSAYFRHFHFGLLCHDGTPKQSARVFDPSFGICQWFQFGDERSLELAVRWLQRLGVRHVRTGLSWAESHMAGGWEWFDRLVAALDPFDVCATLCFTPPSRGIRADHTSPPRDPGEFAAFAAEVARRYVPAHRDPAHRDRDHRDPDRRDPGEQT